MPSERLAQLRSMLTDEPGDPFLRYAIALERKRDGDMEGAAEDLSMLVHEDPKYIACYYQLALVLADLGRTEEAIHVCEVGSAQCIVTRDLKARAELLQLMDTLSGADA